VADNYGDIFLTCFNQEMITWH